MPPGERGFTLIELLVVLILIGLLASYGIPRYLEISDKANASVCKGALAGIRAALVLHYYEAKLKGVDAWPTLADVQDNADNNGSAIMQYGNLPNNPFSTGPDRDLVIEVNGKPHPNNNEGAWAYNPRTGEFWANTASGCDF